MNIPPKDGEITAAAVLLSMVARNPNVTISELLQLARNRGLRGGALPVNAGLELLRQTALVDGHEIASLTHPGRLCYELLGDSEEPTTQFREMLVGLSLGTPSGRVVLSNIHIGGDGRVFDPRGIAQPVFEYLAGLGALQETADGSWQLGSAQDALAIGSLFSDDAVATTSVDALAVGARGEELSLLYETERTGAKPLQVSKIASYFGFDLRSVRRKRSAEPIAVEVKGTAGPRLLVNWTANEAKTALALGDRYFLHIWGEIDLAQPLDLQYPRLRSRNYPVVISSPGHLAREVVGPSADWSALEASRIRTGAFQWEFWTA